MFGRTLVRPVNLMFLFTCDSDRLIGWIPLNFFSAHDIYHIIWCLEAL